MRHRRCINFGLITISVTLYLLGTGQVFAAPGSADEQSTGDGAQLYALFCSDCHGSAPVTQQDDYPGGSDTVDYAQLIEIAQAKKAAEEAATAEEEEWPEWAERPDPNEKKEPDERAEVMSLVTAAIEQAHDVTPESGALDNPDVSSDIDKEIGFNPLPGVTNLGNPQTFFYGTSGEEVFKSIANGTGAAMPGWRTELGNDEAIWDVVNYIRSFWGEEWL